MEGAAATSPIAAAGGGTAWLMAVAANSHRAPGYHRDERLRLKRVARLRASAALPFPAEEQELARELFRRARHSRPIFKTLLAAAEGELAAGLKTKDTHFLARWCAKNEPEPPIDAAFVDMAGLLVILRAAAALSRLADGPGAEGGDAGGDGAAAAAIPWHRADELPADLRDGLRAFEGRFDDADGAHAFLAAFLAERAKDDAYVLCLRQVYWLDEDCLALCGLAA